MGERRSTVGLEATERGERSTERRGLGDGVAASGSAFVPFRPNLLTLGVAGEALLLGVSDEVDLGLEDMAEEGESRSGGRMSRGRCCRNRERRRYSCPSVKMPTLQKLTSFFRLVFLLKMG